VGKKPNNKNPKKAKQKQSTEMDEKCKYREEVKNI